jgi:hypothetical protein
MVWLTSIAENKSLEVDLVDLVGVQIHFPIVLAKDSVHLEPVAIVKPVGDAEITEDPVLLRFDAQL